MDKLTLLSTLCAERKAWDQLIAGVDHVAMTQPGAVGDWSIKDLVAHIANYERYIADRLQEILQGEIYHPSASREELERFLEHFGYPDFGSPLLDDDEPNAWVVEHYRRRSLAEVLRYGDEIFDTLQATIEAFPEEQFTEALARRVASNSFEHYHEHVSDVRAWLARRA